MTVTVEPQPQTGVPLAHYVGGERYAGAGTETLALYNPATGVIRGSVALASVADVDHDRSVLRGRLR